MHPTYPIISHNGFWQGIIHMVTKMTGEIQKKTSTTKTIHPYWVSKHNKQYLVQICCRKNSEQEFFWYFEFF
jgi:hypothetical protein